MAKNAKALQCMCCREWHHCACADLDDGDYLFMSKRFKFGFRWTCDRCVADVDSLMAEKRVSGQMEGLMKDISSLIADKIEGVTGRLDDLEKKIKIGGEVADEINQNDSTFAGIVKRAMQRADEDDMPITVRDHGNSRIIVDQNVLLVNPTEKQPNASEEISGALNEVKQSLQSGAIPVNSCRPTKAGGLVLKFPSRQALETAADTVASTLGEAPVLRVSKPNKALPKITIPNIPKAMLDDDIVDSILKKNANIRKLVDKGHVFSLLLTLKREDTKTAVIKTAPEVRSEIMHSGGRVFVGLVSCRVYDRVWVRQCYHCQGFSHNADSCSKRDQEPNCVYCAGKHRSKDCTNKSNPKCVNCMTTNSEGPLDHFASSVDCPAMTLQRQRVIDGTNYVSSKN